MIMGLYMFSKGASRLLINLFSRAALSVSYSTILTGLRSLTTDASKKVQAAVKEKDWYVVYDNINIAFRRSDQRLLNTDTFENGALATIIICDTHCEPDLDDNPARHLTLDHLIPHADNEDHLRLVFRHHLTKVLNRRIPALDSRPECVMPAPTKRLLPYNATTTFPLPSMNIDQSSIQGNQEILNAIMESALELPPEWFNNRRLILAGDQLTVSRLRSLKQLRWDDVSTYHRLDWAIPVMQLFHMQMLLASTILRTHYGSMSAPGSLAYNAVMLGRKRVNLDKPDFHATDELLRHTFDGIVLRLWEIEMGHDDIESFAFEGSADELKDFVDRKVTIILERYFTTVNLDQLNGTASRNAALFLRDMMVYMELSSAIKCGDIGRIEESIRWITIIFQAGSTMNYANELLHFHCGLFHSWSEQTKLAVMSSLLVNTSGQKDRFLPADLFQEHMNLQVKTIHAAKGSNASWEFIAKAVSTNVGVFASIERTLETQFEVPKSGSKHAQVSAAADIRSIISSLKATAILMRDIPLSHECHKDLTPVTDLFVKGIVKLSEGKRLQSFLAAHARNHSRPTEPMDIAVDMDKASLFAGSGSDVNMTGEARQYQCDDHDECAIEHYLHDNNMGPAQELVFDIDVYLGELE
ncbi:hypothetical protein BGZ54_004123 [Gamsiella multidivaricata]|nr:hypothetical protein BGZ54_004123 [Gamsiella multidivaricata]